MPTLREAHFRHARHYQDVGHEAQQLYLKGGENMVRALEYFDGERVHIEVALDCLTENVKGVYSNTQTQCSKNSPACDNDSYQLKLHAAATLFVTLASATLPYTGYLRFHARQRIRWLEAQSICARITLNRTEETAAYRHLGVAYWNLGEPSRAIEYHEKTLGIAREIGNRREEGSALGNLGIAYSELGDTRRAIEFYEQALIIDREIGDQRGEGNALGNLGIAYTELGDARKAVEFHSQALTIDRRLGDRQGEGMDLGNLGSAYLVMGEAGMAVKFCEQAIMIAREIGDQRGEANDLFTSALAFNKLGDLVQAVTRTEAALKIFESLEDPNAAKVRAELTKWRSQSLP
jgi:tetratricopeptide (TPR) repeat protein